MRNIVSIKNSYSVLQFPGVGLQTGFSSTEAKMMAKGTKFNTFRIIVTAVLELG